MPTTSRSLVLVALSLLAGCIPPPPKRVDSLQSARNRDLRKLTVGLILTENTANAAEYINQVRAKSGPFAGQINPDGPALLKEIEDSLETQFGRAIRVKDAAEAREEGAHMLAVADLFAKVGTLSFKLTSLDIAVDFRNLDGESVSVVRGRGTGRVPYPAYTVRWDTTARAALDGFRVALSTDSALAAYAAQLAPTVAAPPRAVAAQPSPEPAATYASDVESPAFRLPEDESKFALVVGVEAYQGLPAARHAARDAKSVRASLLAAGYPERNIVFLTDAQAGRSALDKYLDAWLPKNAGEGSTVFFYFSGHGAPDAEKGDAYLMPWDGDAKFVSSTGYPVRRVYEKLGALKAKRVLVALDACFSGAGGRSVIAEGTRPLVAKVDTGAAAAGRVSALSAAAADEITGVDEASGHGLFTYHLLKGLAAKGGRASFKQLFDYLSPKVRDAARRDNRDQTPQMVGAGDASL